MKAYVEEELTFKPIKITMVLETQQEVNDMYEVAENLLDELQTKVIEVFAGTLKKYVRKPKPSTKTN